MKMTGWKTKLGGIGGIFTGLAGFIAGIISDPVDPVLAWGGLCAAWVSMTGLGIGHKIEKNS